MKSRMSSLGLIGVLALTGCAGGTGNPIFNSAVKKAYIYAPGENSDGLGVPPIGVGVTGEVRYCASGMAQLVPSRKKEALAAAANACGGDDKYAVMGEMMADATLDWWSKVWPEAARDFNALAYNRPGYGRSEPGAEPRDGAHVVSELRRLLEGQRLPKPYVLVGHSIGGHYMQLFARQHPDEVLALLLVDSTHPEQLRGPGAQGNWPAWLKIACGALTSSVAKNELDALDATGQMVLGLPPPLGPRVIVLSAQQPMKEHSPLADDANRKRAALAGLYPGTTQVWVDSGGGIRLEKPDAVLAAIRDAIQPHRSPDRPAQPS